MLEHDPLFEDDDDGSKTKEVRAASYRAEQIAKERRFQYPSVRGSGFRGGRGARGGFGGRGKHVGRGGYGGGGYGGGGYGGGGYGGGDYGGSGYGGAGSGFAGQIADSSAPVAAAPAPICFRFRGQGHYQKFCRVAQPGSTKN